MGWELIVLYHKTHLPNTFFLQHHGIHEKQMPPSHLFICCIFSSVINIQYSAVCFPLFNKVMGHSGHFKWHMEYKMVLSPGCTVPAMLSHSSSQLSLERQLFAGDRWKPQSKVLPTLNNEMPWNIREKVFSMNGRGCSPQLSILVLHADNFKQHEGLQPSTHTQAKNASFLNEQEMHLSQCIQSVSHESVFLFLFFFKLSKRVCWAKFLIMYTSPKWKDKPQPIHYI